MCFFKAKLPEAIKPEVMAAVPDNATAPEPNAPVFGGTQKALMDSGETGGKTGISSLKVKPAGKASLVMPAVTGANTTMGFNG